MVILGGGFAGLLAGAYLKKAGIEGVKLEQTLPFLGALLKKEQDLVTFADHLAGGRRYRS